MKRPIIFLAPMAGVADYGMRRVCREFGADRVVSEMVSSKAVSYGDKKTEYLARIRADERPCVLQLFGSEPQTVALAAKRMEEMYHPDGIDINFGCPAPKIFKNGDGSALLKDVKKCGEIVRQTVAAVQLPVSAKIRLGIEEGGDVSLDAAKEIEAAGAAYVTVHGRYREQFYSGKADWKRIAAVKAALTIPVIANGDVTDIDSAKEILRVTKADGIMIGRGAMGNPYLFRMLSAYFDDGTILAPQSVEERMQTALRQLEYTIEDKGEELAVREMRKHFAWYGKGFRNAAKYKLRCNTICTKEDCLRLAEDALKILE